MAVTSPASIFSYPTNRTFAAFTIASAASIIATSPRHSTIPSASMFLPLKFDRLISQRMNRRGDATAAADEGVGRELVDGHDRRGAEEAAELDRVADIFAGDGDDAHGRRLVVQIGRAHV